MKSRSRLLSVIGLNVKLSILFMIAAGLAGCGKAEIKNIDSRGKYIICLGDSITFGYGVSRGYDYPAVLSKMLKTPIINVGVDGDTSADALARLERDVLSQNPKIVMVEFGGNDLLKKISLPQTMANIEKIVDLIHNDGAMVVLVDVSAGMFMRDYRLGIKKIAREKKCLFVPQVLEGIITNPRLKSDFFHPSEEGYQLIAQRVCKVITPYLKNNKALP